MSSGKLLEELDSASSPGGPTWALSFSAATYTLTRIDYETKDEIGWQIAIWTVDCSIDPLVEKLALFKWAGLV